MGCNTSKVEETPPAVPRWAWYQEEMQTYKMTFEIDGYQGLEDRAHLFTDELRRDYVFSRILHRLQLWQFFNSTTYFLHLEFTATRRQMEIICDMIDELRDAHDLELSEYH